MLKHRAPRSMRRSRGALAVEHLVSEASRHRAQGRYDKARDRLKLVLDADPLHTDGHFEAGMLARQTGKSEPAIQHFVAALRGAPDRADCWLALAAMLTETNRLGDARALMEKFKTQGFSAEQVGVVLKAFVDDAYSKGRALYDTDDLVRSESFFELVIAFDETHADATYYAGVIAARTNRLQAAFDLLGIAIYRDPTRAAFFTTLGTLLHTMGDDVGSISAQEKAIALDPDLAMAHSNLAAVLTKHGDIGRSIEHARRAIALDPSYAGAYVNLGVALKTLGEMPNAIEAYDKALSLDPTMQHAHSNRLFAKLYAESFSPEDYARDARTYAATFADHALRTRPFAHDRDPNRQLRIGFVSSDLFGHAVARFLEPCLAHLDRSQLHIRAYMARVAEDETSARLRTLFDGWANIAGLNDDEAADLIEADAIDILVDLSGHSGGHRLLVFARKPAPIQVTWIGHPATTGLAAMDYRLTDGFHDPEGLTEHLHTETLWRLPGVSATYQPPADIPDIRARMPFDDNGFVTFGALNRFEKIGDEALGCWARILRETPDARLFMVINDVDKPGTRARIEARLEQAGLPLDRLNLHPRVTSGYFELYHRIDILLDPFPYSGGTTSCDTLCMGVPFVTLGGRHAPARAGVLVLSAVGLQELIAETTAQYVDLVLALAGDPTRLRAIRSGLRERMFSSALMDPKRLAADIGDAFRAMWQRWLAATGNP
ncbi:tetratricopeptide repeat protein [Methylobacterium sp. C25]|nr:tetratricopeptide repeat protein [Methylobacterium sp. C25]